MIHEKEKQGQVLYFAFLEHLVYIYLQCHDEFQ